jgi:predicted PurR-regulated permease PerM
VIFNPLENVLRPYLISRGSSLPILLILLGMLGGLAAFGLLGIFVGPTILAIGHALVTEWVEPLPLSPD